MMNATSSPDTSCSQRSGDGVAPIARSGVALLSSRPLRNASSIAFRDRRTRARLPSCTRSIRCDCTRVHSPFQVWNRAPQLARSGDGHTNVAQSAQSARPHNPNLEPGSRKRPCRDRGAAEPRWRDWGPPHRDDQGSVLLYTRTCRCGHGHLLPIKIIVTVRLLADLWSGQPHALFGDQQCVAAITIIKTGSRIRPGGEKFSAHLATRVHVPNASP